MPIREELLAVLENYQEARKDAFKDHPMAQRIRVVFPTTVGSVFPADDSLIFAVGSPGKGNWVSGPWVAVFDRLVTQSAQNGFYPVYLFAEDTSRVYLSLNQAMTEAKKRYKASAKIALKARAINFRAMLGSNIQPFNHDEIDLTPAHSRSNTAFYQAGNICSICYSADDMPSEEVLVSHLTRAL